MSGSEFTATFTFIRHGESTDNGKPIWAGFKDAPLSDLGLKQADLLGQWLATNGVTFSKIYVSDLQRAKQTANAILKYHPDPKPPLIKEYSLREINFGKAEGKPYTAERIPGVTIEQHYERGIFPHIRNRTDRFPGGESKDDVANRAEKVIQDLVLPDIVSAMESDRARDHRVAIVSHGVFLRELLYALHKRCGISAEYSYLSTTAWTRVEIKAHYENLSSDSLPISMKVTDVNQSAHLKGQL